MKYVRIALITSAALLSGQALAAEPQNGPAAGQSPTEETVLAAPDAQSAPMQLSLAELDRVTAGDLGLPNGMVMFEGFDNAAPGAGHPNFGRSPTGFENSGNEGPWSAANNSPAIEFVLP